MKNNYLILLLSIITLMACGETTTSHRPIVNPTTSTRPVVTSVDYDKLETNINDFTFVEVAGGYAVSKYVYKNRSTTRVVIPETYSGKNVVRINEEAFVLASGIKKVVISKNIKVIEDAAFEGCNSVSWLEVASENQYYSSDNGLLFNKTKDTLYFSPEGIESVVLPNSVKTIHKKAFYRSLAKSINLNDGVETIGDYCFSKTKELIELNMPDSVVSIGNGLFENAFKIKNVKLSNSLKVLPAATFALCPAILEINIPDSVTTIERIAITDNDYLKKITFGKNVEFVGEWAIIRNTFLKEVVVSPKLNTICDNAFSSNDHLTTITLNEGLETIGAGAFALCPSLPKINIPSTVHTIGEGFVANDKKLASIDVDSNNQHFKNENGVLLTKDGTRLLSYPSNKDGYSYNVPSTVSTIDREAFSYCIRISYKEGVENIDGRLTLPVSVKKIGAYAFSYSNTITEIYYEGTTEQFKSISTSYIIEGESVTAFSLSSVSKIICSNGNVTAQK